MAENNMEKIAQLLGIKLNEPFRIERQGSKTFRLTSQGLREFYEGGECSRHDVLNMLLCGGLSIKKEPWKAKEGEIYFTPSIRESKPSATSAILKSVVEGEEIYNTGLMCKTEEQAIELMETLIKAARKFQGFTD